MLRVCGGYVCLFVCWICICSGFRVHTPQLLPVAFRLARTNGIASKTRMGRSLMVVCAGWCWGEGQHAAQAMRSAGDDAHQKRKFMTENSANSSCELFIHRCVTPTLLSHPYHTYLYPNESIMGWDDQSKTPLLNDTQDRRNRRPAEDATT